MFAELTGKSSSLWLFFSYLKTLDLFLEAFLIKTDFFPVIFDWT